MTPPPGGPCSRCGATPAWPVVWKRDGQEVAGYLLCADCDEAEERELREEERQAP